MLKCFCENPMPLDSDDLCATKCGHLFHDGCLLQWLRINSNCPQCRTHLRMNEKFRLYPTLSEGSETEGPESLFSEALENLDKTQIELNQVTYLCNIKDDIIATMKEEMKRDKYKKEYETLKHLLGTVSGENLDVLFDDHELYTSVLRGETSLDIE